MAFETKVQRDYFLTEVTIAVPANVQEVDALLQATKTNGKMVVQYNHGVQQGVNIEQRTRIPESKAMEVRELLALGTTEL